MLTPREREVCDLVVSGLRNKQIADRLGTAEKTVKIHRGQVMHKLGVRSVVELVRMVDRVGERTAVAQPNRTARASRRSGSRRNGCPRDASSCRKTGCRHAFFALQVHARP